MQSIKYHHTTSIRLIRFNDLPIYFQILKDVTLKYHVINQRKVHYKPGWDCHGLPIELKAMSSSAHQKLSPLEVRQTARAFALDTLDKQKNEFASWGITADWNDIYRTLDSTYIQNQLRLFAELYKKKLVYRDMKPVFWSPSSGTALAEAELEYDPQFSSPSLTFRLKMTQSPNAISQYTNDSVYALIWTTTPWTLPANQAVCFNSELTYALVKLSGTDGQYIVASSLVHELTGEVQVLTEFAGTELAGCTYEHPIDSDSVLPFLSGKHVQSTKGTGLVHTAPAHGPDDFLVALEHKIPIVNTIPIPKQDLCLDLLRLFSPFRNVSLTVQAVTMMQHRNSFGTSRYFGMAMH